MRFSLVGIDHQRAAVAIRERVAISAGQLQDSLALLRLHVPHGIILSTCNRTEIYSAGNGGADPQKASLEFLRTRLDVTDAELLDYVYTSEDRQAAEHLFRVASGLESMIVGEFEVLGQMRQALDAAEKAGMVSLPLRHAFYGALRTGRRVREETGISKNALSVSSVAVDLAARIIGDLKKCKMLVIGAGEAGRLVAKVAGDMGTPDIVIASRTKERAEELASTLRGTAIDLDSLPDELMTANVVVTCAGAPHRIMDVSHIETVMRDRAESPLLIIDIALPRNVEPEVGRVPNVFLYNIDDLTEISNANRKQRESEIGRAEEILDAEVGQLVSWWQDSDIRPIVGALMSKAEEIRSAQLNKTLSRLPPLSEEQRENLEAMTKSIVTKILKEPIQYLKSNGNTYGAEMVKEVFQLDAEIRA
ncbi:MAG: glutamyl-tRNA reductase [Chloroflexi bacterium RBG_16_57_8]|nr:MAG: glutamyl-tRNA reductase [Chloroflexi bacterium RBG_16_57_8]